MRLARLVRCTLQRPQSHGKPASFARLVALAIAALATHESSALAQTLTWGRGGGGGSGRWNTTTSDWFNGSANVPWTQGDSAIFGGSPGLVDQTVPITAQDLTFGTSGYLVAGNTLTLGVGSTPTVTLGAGNSATIGSLIAGTKGLTLTGGGTLRLTNAANSWTGGATVSQGLLIFSNGALGSNTITLGDANTGANSVALEANFGNFTGTPISNNIVVGASGTGSVSIGSTVFSPGSNGTIYNGTVTLNRDVTLVGGNKDRTSFTGQITGTGNITIVSTNPGSRVTIDNTANSFRGNVTINPGATLQTDNSEAIPNTSSMTVNGAVQFALPAAGGETIDALNGSSAGVIRIISSFNTPVTVTVGAANGSGSYSGLFQDSSKAAISFAKIGTGTEILSGTSSNAGTTTVAGGTLSISSLANGGIASNIGKSSSAAGNLVLDGGTLQYTGASTSTDRLFTLNTGGGAIDASGSGQLAFANAGAIALSGAGARTLTLTGSNTGANTFAPAIGDNGGPTSLVKTGSGEWVLTGVETYSGTTSVNAGALLISGTLTASPVAVGSGGTLRGIGTIAGLVAVANGGAIAPGDAPGTLTVGTLTLNPTSVLNYELGTVNTVGGPTNDLLNVNGALTLDGTLNVTDAGGFTTGSYRLINYTGALTDNGLAIGTIPNGFRASVQTAVPNEINLVAVGPGGIEQFWDGATAKGDGAIHGGSGTWDNTTTSWTAVNGLINVAWQSSFGTFTGTAGTVTATEPVAFQGLGFQTDGYVVSATGSGALVPATNAGINVITGETVTISAPLTGSGSIVKGENGTLALTGNNTFTGGIVLASGTLQAGSNAALGSGPLAMSDFTTFGAIADNLSFANAVTLSGSNTIDTGTNTLTLSGAIADGAAPGILTKVGAGTLVLTGANTYSGGTTLSAGTLAVGDGAALGTGPLAMAPSTTLTPAADNLSLADAVTLTGRATIDSGSNTLTVAGPIADGTSAGGLIKTGTGTLILTGANTYSGGTTISAGTLQGAASAFGTGDIADSGALVFDQPADGTYAGAITGTGPVTKEGAGALTLNGTSAYSGPTNVNAGKLLVDGTLEATAVNVANGATLGGTGTIAGAVTVASGGAITPGDAPGTLTVGPLTLNSGSVLNYALGTASTVGGPASDLINVNGPLTLAGTLNVTSGLDFVTASYRLINYTGPLTDNGLAIGTIPSGVNAVVQTAIPGQVNLVVIGPGAIVQFWDGTTISGDAAIQGGSGPWNSAMTNWTDLSGNVNGRWQSSFGVFSGPAGTVEVTDPISFQGLQFQTDGYVVTASAGGSLTPVGAFILVSPGVTATIAAPIVGTDSLTKADGGTLVLTGTNTFSGGLQLIAGTLQVDNNTALGTGTLAMSDTTTLGASANNLTLANAVTLAGANTIDTGANTLTLSGVVADGANSGNLAKAGTGALILTGTNTYSGGTTIEAGTLAGAVSAFGGGGIVDDGALIIDQATNATYASAISGTGSVTKSGAGSLTLTGTSSYSGPTDVTAGTLIVNGAIAASPVTLQSGTTLGGSGTVGGITALGGATVAPADAPFSTLNVNGNVTFAPGSVLVVNVNPAGQNDRVTATGTATIQGGTVNVLAAPGSYLPATTYTLVSASGGLTGNFSTLNTNTNFAFLTPVLSTDPNDVFLTLQEKLVTPPGGGVPQLQLASVATTPNEVAVADTLQALAAPVSPDTPFVPAAPLNPGVPSELVPVFDAVLGETPAAAELAFNELDGEIYASTIAAILSDSRLPREAILDRLNEPCEKPEWKPDPARPARRPCDREAFHFWAQGFGNWGSTAGDADTAPTSRVTDGFAVGMDTTLMVWDSAVRAGFAAGYYHDALDDPGRTSRADIDSGFLSLYGGTDFGIATVRGGFIYTFDSTSAFRAIVFPGLSTFASASYNGHSTQEFLELGHILPMGDTSLEPFAGVSSIQLHQDPFDESTDAAALRGLGSEHTLTTTILGLRAQGAVSDEAPLYARLAFGWRHAFGSVNPTATLAFEGTTDFFDVTGAPINRDAVETDIGFDYAVSNAVSIGLSYLGEHGGSANDNAVRGHVDVSL
jgi:outer membrane autotransporter protein